MFALGLRLTALNQSFWLDEAAQAIISIRPFEKGHFNNDFQPPLSYYFTFVWMQFGHMLGQRSEWFLRLPMVAFSVTSVYVLFLLLKRTMGLAIGLVGSLMLATAPFHIYYAQEHRMYALLTLVSLLSWYYLWEKQWKSYTLVIAIGMYTHYFMLLSISAQIVYVLLTERKNVHKFFIAIACASLLFAPWIPTLAKQYETSQHLIQAWPGWAHISNIGVFRFPGLVIAKFSVGMISPSPKWLYGGIVGVFSLVLIGSALIVVYMWLKRRLDRKALFFWLCMGLVPFLAAWVGGVFVSASSPWRIQFILPALYGLIAYSLCMTWSHLAHRVNNNIVAGIAVYLVVQNLFFVSLYLFDAQNHRENWREAVAYTDMYADRGSLVVSEYIAPWAPMDWYSRYFKMYVGGSTTQHMTTESVSTKLDPMIAGYENVVLYTYLYEISDPQQLVNAYLLENGYTLRSQKDFRGVGIVNVYERVRP